MTISWEISKHVSLLGEVVEELPNHYVVIVTSYSHSKAKKELGKRWIVKKQVKQ